MGTVLFAVDKQDNMMFFNVRSSRSSLRALSLFVISSKDIGEESGSLLEVSEVFLVEQSVVVLFSDASAMLLHTCPMVTYLPKLANAA